MKLKNIVNGWKNLAKEKLNVSEDHIVKQSEERREICEGCDLNLNWVCNPLRSERHKYIDNWEVSGCGCPLKAKTAAQYEECPLGKWGLMLDYEDFGVMVSISERYKTLSYYSSLYNGKVILHNNNKDSFNTADGIVSLNYRAIPKAVEQELLTSYALFNGEDVLAYNKHACIFEPTEEFIQKVIEIKENNKNIDIVVWIHPTFYPERLDGVKIRTAVEYLKEKVKELTDSEIYYLFTSKDDLEYLVEILVNSHYLHERSILNLNEDTINKFYSCLLEILHQEI